MVVMMTSDQTFKKIKKRSSKDGLAQPHMISRNGNRWFLIDKMQGDCRPSTLVERMLGKLGDQRK